jgi:hypothetical protein
MNLEGATCMDDLVSVVVLVGSIDAPAGRTFAGSTCLIPTLAARQFEALGFVRIGGSPFTPEASPGNIVRQKPAEISDAERHAFLSRLPGPQRQRLSEVLRARIISEASRIAPCSGRINVIAGEAQGGLVEFIAEGSAAV